jgi:hypothetical protein
MTFLSGGAYGFISGEITGLLGKFKFFNLSSLKSYVLLNHVNAFFKDDIQELKPTNVPMVPKLVRAIY